MMKLTRADGLGFEEGNFASNGQELMYVTDSEAWLVGNSLVQLKEYRKNDNF